MSDLSSSSTGPANAAVDLLERYFSYQPNPYGAGFFAIMFCSVIMMIIIQTLMYCMNKPNRQPNPNTNQQVSSWTDHGYKLLWIVMLTAICLLIGLSIRINMVVSHPTLMLYVVHQGFLIISPNALAFVNYSLLGLIISTSEYVNPSLLTTQRFFLRGKLISRCFLLSDVFAFFIQTSSTPLLTNTDPSIAQRGSNIMVAGLIVQIGFFTMFTCITRYIHTNEKYKSTRPNIMNQFFGLLYFTISCLYIRSIYRVIEFSQSSHHLPEPYFFVFDMSVLTLCMLAYVLWRNPANILRVAQTQEELSPSVGMTTHGKEHVVP